MNVPQMLLEIVSHVDESEELMASPMPEIRSEIQSKIEITFFLFDRKMNLSVSRTGSSPYVFVK